LIIERLSRAVVLVSLLAAVAVGVAPYAARPAVALGLAATVLATAVAARLQLTYAAAVVLLLAYVAYGLVRLAGGLALAPTPFWLAAFVGLAIGGGSWTSWRARAPWRLPIAWWAVGVAMSWPVVAARETNFAFDNPVVTGTIVGAAVVQMACALWIDTILAERRGFGPERRGFRGLSAVEGSPGVASALAASAVITGLVAIYQRFVDIAWLSGNPWADLGRATGMMGDANPMGVVTALWAPLVLAAVFRRSDEPGVNLPRRFASLGFALLLWTAAWASGARTTLILFTAAAVGLAIGWAMGRGIGLRRMAYGGVLAAALVAVLLAIALPRLPASSPVGRLAATLPRASPGAVLYELLWRRDGYGIAAVEAIAEHPLNGIGVGRFSALAPAYYARIERRAIPPDNAQNLWRHTLAERGLLGLLPIAWLTLLAIAAICRRTSDPQHAVLNTMVAGLGLVLTFGYPVQDPAVAATVATLVGMTGRRAQPSGVVHAAPRALWTVALVVAALGAVMDFFG
jgi:O-antigen ligase